MPLFFGSISCSEYLFQYCTFSSCPLVVVAQIKLFVSRIVTPLITRSFGAMFLKCIHTDLGYFLCISKSPNGYREDWQVVHHFIFHSAKLPECISQLITHITQCTINVNNYVLCINKLALKKRSSNYRACALHLQD